MGKSVITFAMASERGFRSRAPSEANLRDL